MEKTGEWRVETGESGKRKIGRRRERGRDIERERERSERGLFILFKNLANSK